MRIRLIFCVIIAAIIAVLAGCGGPTPAQFPTTQLFAANTPASFSGEAGSYIIQGIGDNVTVSVKNVADCGEDADQSLLGQVTVTIIHDGNTSVIKSGQAYSEPNGNGNWIIRGDVKGFSDPEARYVHGLCYAHPKLDIVLPNGGKVIQLASY